MNKELILEVKNLSTTFQTERGPLKAIDGISFQVYKGEILGIVGESGCGKSVTSQSIMRLYDEKYTAKYSGEVLLEGQDLMKLPYKKMQDIRGKKISMVFQDALSSLNPVFTIGNQICEPLRIHQKLGKKEAEEKAVEMLNMGVMLITHDLGVVAETCSRVVVMYLGQIVEEASVADIFDNPKHPYTWGLIQSIPRLDGDRTKPLYTIKGMVPLLSQIPNGCRFAPRCPYATERCRKEMPPLVKVTETQNVRCFKYMK